MSNFLLLTMEDAKTMMDSYWHDYCEMKKDRVFIIKFCFGLNFWLPPKILINDQALTMSTNLPVQNQKADLSGCDSEWGEKLLDLALQTLLISLWVHLRIGRIARSLLDAFQAYYLLCD